MDWADQLDMMDDDCDIEGFPMEKLFTGERTKEDLVVYFDKRVAREIDMRIRRLTLDDVYIDGSKVSSFGLYPTKE